MTRAEFERLRLAYAEACEARGMAHASGTRDEWLTALDRQIAARAALFAAMDSALDALDRAERLARAWEGHARVCERNADEWRQRSTTEQPFATQVAEREAMAASYRACVLEVQAALSASSLPGEQP